MKKTIILTLCILTLLCSSVYANTTSKGHEIKLEDIIKEYTDLYLNSEEFEIEAKTMNMSVEELILCKSEMAYKVRTAKAMNMSNKKLMLTKPKMAYKAGKDVISKKGVMSTSERALARVSGSLYSVNVPVIMQPNKYTCGPTSALQVLYALGDQNNVSGITNVEKIDTLSKSMLTTTDGTLVGKVTGGINLYASSNLYSYYKRGTHFTSSEQLKEKIKTSLEFGVPPIIHAKTGAFYHYKYDTGHYIVISAIDISTNIVTIKDCTYLNGCGGTFQVSLAEVYHSLYDIETNEPRYLICLTQ